MILIFAGIALIILGSAVQAGSSSGGFILIGPFPILFGTGRYGGELSLLSLILGILMLVFVMIWAVKPRTPPN